MLVPNPAIRTPRTQIALARDEVCYVGQTVAVVIADSRYLAEDAAAAVGGGLRAAAGGERLPRRAQARRRAGAQRPFLERRGLRADELRRRGRGVQERAARVRGGDVSASRRRHDAGGPRRAGERGRGDRPAHGLVVDPDAASVPRHARRPVRTRPRIDPRDRAVRRRRLRHQGAVLSRGGGDPGRRDQARPAGEMAGGPARAFPLRHAGARPVLDRRHRGRPRRKNPRPARHHGARHRRVSAVGHHRAVHCGDDVSGSLRRAGLQDRDHGGADQPGADHGGARRRPAAGGVRHGAADGPRRARTQARPQRGARAQHDPARADALRAGADVPRRQADGLCQRRFSAQPAPRRGTVGVRAFPRAAGRGAPAGPLYRHRHRQLCRGHRPRSVRGRDHPRAAERQGRGRDRRDHAGPGHAHHAVADRGRPSRLPDRRHRHDRRRHRRDLAGRRRVREPAGDQRRLIGDDRGRGGAQAGDRRGVARARHSGKRHRRRGRQGDRAHRQPAER